MPQYRRIPVFFPPSKIPSVARSKSWGDRMFDWDKDYDELVQTRPRQSAAARTPSRIGFSFGLIVLAALFVMGAGYLGQSTWRSAWMSVEMADAVALDFVEALLPQLHALDLGQARNFLAGLRDFTDHQLLDYAGHAQRDHETAAQFMRPYLADAVLLISQELTRRGF